MCLVTDSDDTGISIDEAKLLIQGLVEKVDSDKREELVEWMNTLQPNIGESLSLCFCRKHDVFRYRKK